VTLDTHTAAANRVWPDLQDEVWIKDDTVHLARLEARELPPGVARLQERLTRLFPRVRIAQLLLEVNHYPTPSVFGALHRGSRWGNFMT
jgi:hypothetical protein